MRLLLLAAFGPILSASLALPGAAQQITLKCTYLIDHVDKGKNTPEHNWLTFNPGLEFGVASWINRKNEEVTVKGMQFITASSYKLKHAEVGTFGWTRTWSVDRSTGKLRKTQEFTENRSGQAPIVSSGKCSKAQPKKVLY
jgi:hypothetical protein